MILNWVELISKKCNFPRLLRKSETSLWKKSVALRWIFSIPNGEPFAFGRTGFGLLLSIRIVWSNLTVYVDLFGHRKSYRINSSSSVDVKIKCDPCCWHVWFKISSKGLCKLVNVAISGLYFKLIPSWSSAPATNPSGPRKQSSAANYLSCVLKGALNPTALSSGWMVHRKTGLSETVECGTARKSFELRQRRLLEPIAIGWG